MSTYRRMRRQARQARRSGLQPMMVINSGEPFPETAGVLLLRWAWRYRSELAPARRHRRHRVRGLVAARRPAALVGARRGHGRRGRAGRWPPSARGGDCPRGSSACMRPTAIYAAGVWLAAATALGPFVSPLPQALAIGALDPVGAVVGTPAPARESPRRAQASSLARYRQGHRAGRITGHVRHGGRMGMARTVPPGTRPDHHRRGRAGFPRSNPAWGHSGARCASIRPRMTWPTGARFAFSTWTRTRAPYRGPGRP